MSIEWDFSKLPEREHAVAGKAVADADIDTLRGLMNKYRLSNYNYCCGDETGIYTWFRDAVEKKIINAENVIIRPESGLD